MKVVGLTGGIGSGKSTVARMFEELGVSVYIADDEAKKQMTENIPVKEQIVKLFGKEAYLDAKLNKPYIANIVFNDKEKLHALNAIVHPVVAEHFTNWKNKQTGKYVIKEAAILFENDGYKKCDYVILVSAPVETRIQRVLKRDDSMTRESIQARMDNQWKDIRKVDLSSFVIYNDDIKETKLKIYEIHNIISSYD